MRSHKFKKRQYVQVFQSLSGSNNYLFSVGQILITRNYWCYVKFNLDKNDNDSSVFFSEECLRPIQEIPKDEWALTLSRSHYKVAKILRSSQLKQE